MKRIQRGRPRDLVLFIDARFWENEKARSLTPTERDQWLMVLAEHLRNGNGSELPAHFYGVPPARRRRLLEVGFVDEIEGRLHIHDWDDWNGRTAYKRFLARERKRRQRGDDEG